MLAETIEVLAKITGVDLISGVLDKVDSSFAKMSEEASLAAAKAEEAAAKLDAAMLTTVSGEDAVTLATSEAQAARERLAAATEQQATAERNLMARTEEANAVDDRNAATMERLVTASDELTAAQTRTAEAAKLASDAEARLAEVTRAASGANVTAAREAALAADAQGAATVKAGEASTAAMGKAKTAAFGAAAIVAGIGYESVKSAMDFQTLTQRLVTTAGESQGALGTIRSGIMQVAQQTGSSANDLAKSMYIVEAAGFDAAHGGLDVLKASTEGAKLEGSDFGTVANAVTDILKDYHKGAGQAANVTSQLVAAVSVGKANFQTMSASMANVLPLASAVGIKFNDVAGVLAEMTSHGMTAQRASQNIAMALRSLEGPSKAMVKEWKLLGISTDQVTQSLSTRGLGGTLDWLAKTAAAGAPKIGQTYAGALKATIGTAAGLNVALMTTGENSKDTAAAIAKIGAASADANGHVKGFSDLQKTAGYQMDALKNSLVNTGIAIGTALLPAVTSIAKAIGNVVTPIMKWIQSHQTLVKDLFEGVAAIIAVVGAVKMVTVAVEIFEGVMALLEANPWVAAISALILILIYCWTHFKTFRDVVMDVMKVVGAIIKGTVDAIVAVWKFLVTAGEAVWHALEAAWNSLVGAAKAVWGFLTGIWNDIVSVTTTVWNGISGFFQKWWPLLLLIFATPIAVLMAAWNHFHTEITSVAKSVWDGIKSFFVGTWHFIQAMAQVAWNMIKFFIVTPIQEAWHLIQPVIHMLQSFLSGAWNFILGVVQGAWNLIKHYIVQPIVDAYNTVMGWIHNFEQIGQDIVTGIINGVSGAASWLINKMENLASDALKAAKSFLGIGSPSKEFADQVGKWIPHGIAQGITDNAHVAHRALNDLATGLTASGKASLGNLSLTAGMTAGFSVGGIGGGGSVVNIHIHAENSTLMTDRDMDVFVQKIEKRLATITLPSGGYRSRF